MAYSVRDYAAMFADRVRVEAYLAALAATITPGCTVLDLGTGTGIFAVAACQLGARKVYAIEPADAIQLAHELAVANGFADRIELLHASSLEVTLDEQVDVLIHDLRGSLPVHRAGLAAVSDARRRFLKPGGVMVGLRDTIQVAVVESATAYAAHRKPWGELHPDTDLRSIEHVLLNSWGPHGATAEELVTAPAAIATIDYRTVEAVSMSGVATAVALRPATGHGVQLWFDAELADGITFSTAPMGRRMVYGTCFLAWSEPVTLAPGDEITVHLDAHLLGDEYVWRWRTRVVTPGVAKPRAVYDQSTFFAKPVPPASLARRAASHRTHLDVRGQVDRHVLERMSEGATVGDIARDLAERWPARFRSEDDAIAHVGALSDQYGR